MDWADLDDENAGPADGEVSADVQSPAAEQKELGEADVEEDSGGVNWADTDEEEEEEEEEEVNAESVPADVEAGEEKSEPAKSEKLQAEESTGDRVDWADSDDDNDLGGGNDDQHAEINAGPDAAEEQEQPGSDEAVENLASEVDKMQTQEEGSDASVSQSKGTDAPKSDPLPQIPQVTLEQGPPYTVYVTRFKRAPPAEIKRDMYNFLSDCTIEDIRCSKDKDSNMAKAIFVDLRDELSLRKALAKDRASFQGERLLIRIAEPKGASARRNGNTPSNSVSGNRRDGSGSWGRIDGSGSRSSQHFSGADRVRTRGNSFKESDGARKGPGGDMRRELQRGADSNQSGGPWRSNTGSRKSGFRSRADDSDDSFFEASSRGNSSRTARNPLEREKSEKVTTANPFALLSNEDDEA
eukprot:CAMPEP_0198730650 /NCGR_PEP_ID=MMETSP1475-20131203/25467_1 /TAXON_ID= ORGANISM="Unidentified sp., Strain CCMP1999" /NCGR_SAMPLE_ID=MMETSP1475 /ASSEMBLY_ACC=CAM_ASM_001111 /LENGTH=411 /DNA_ID=CAMNT_0044493483 /DNA_START=93 /DNA_END=1328 /DNA_ORIENTATION=-